MDTSLFLQVLGAVAVVGAIIWRGGKIQGVVESHLEQNAEEHLQIRQSQDDLWRHQKAQDDLLREHDLDIATIKEKIRGAQA